MALETAERMIRQEIDRLHDHVKRLEGALSHLDGSTGRAAPKRKRTAAAPASRRKTSANGRRRRGSRKRLSPAERHEQVLSIVKKRPGIKQSDLAREAGVTPAYISGLVKKLQSARKIEKVDGGLLAR
jgi:hypothetical protein